MPGRQQAGEQLAILGPGDRGVLNAISPEHFNVADALVGATPKPPIVWVRGDRDVIVSDTSLLDRAYLGSIGAIADWPGADACNCGHSPHIERPAEFTAELLKLVNDAAG